MAIVYTRDVKDEKFKIKIGCLEGQRERPNYRQLLTSPLLKYSGLLDNECADLLVECSLETSTISDDENFDSDRDACDEQAPTKIDNDENGWRLAKKHDQKLSSSSKRRICPSIFTTYKYFTNQCQWNEWIEFPIAIRDLPRDIELVLKIWDTFGPSSASSGGDDGILVGVARIGTFGHLSGAMRSGVYDLRVEVTSDNKMEEKENDLLDRLNEFKSNHHNGQMVKIDWLDRLTFLEIEKITQQSKQNSRFMYISVEFPKVLVDNTIDGSIVYLEPDNPIPSTLWCPSLNGGVSSNSFHNQQHQQQQLYFSNQSVRQLDKSNSQLTQINDIQRQQQSSNNENSLLIVPDPELTMDNIIEGKHHKLSRSARSCISDKDLKPNASVRDQLNAIVAYPPTKNLTSEEQDQVWKFRFYLMNQKRALTKFLKCLNWELAIEVKQALELLNSWQPIDIQDALELLSPQFQHQQVRRYAVSRLQQAPDEDLLLYLLQLVQALKYENSDTIIVTSCIESIPKFDDHFFQNAPLSVEGCDLATFLIDRCVADDVLANYFYWYLIVEIENQNQGQTTNTIDNNNLTIQQGQAHYHYKTGGGSGANNKVEQVYCCVLERFLNKLSTSSNELERARYNSLQRQHEFVDKLTQLMQTVAKENRNRLGKIEKLKELLADRSALKYDFCNFDPPLALPLDPHIKITGVEPDQATLFKSQLMPCRLTLRVYTNREQAINNNYSANIHSLPIQIQRQGQQNKSFAPHSAPAAAITGQTIACANDIQSHSSLGVLTPSHQLQQQQQVYLHSLSVSQLVRDSSSSSLRNDDENKSSLATTPSNVDNKTKRSTLSHCNSLDTMITNENIKSPLLRSPTNCSVSSLALEKRVCVIFKHGDDLRQDQLILQTITLMDKLLRRENLDLKLTPYNVLATSTRHGFVQYVDSVSVAEVRATEGSIQNFFRRHAPSPDSPFGIVPEVMDTYVRSCAGYCVITYLLGVGDRHLDNLLLTRNGKLFHIDFGYILGRDPKPLPPPMKLTREMVEAMGGPSSELYSNFLKLCHTAFLHLRRHSSLILNLFALMVDANVPDIALEPDKTVKKVQDKFRLDLTDEEAVYYIQNLIDVSVTDVMAVLVEQIHKFAQYWRK